MKKGWVGTAAADTKQVNGSKKYWDVLSETEYPRSMMFLWTCILCSYIYFGSILFSGKAQTQDICFILFLSKCFCFCFFLWSVESCH